MMDFHTDTQYHIGLRPEDGAAWAILTGDPGRVETIARRLEAPAFVAANREYTTWAGRLAGERVLITSHGIGGPSTAICVEELARCGVKTLLRVGTCGGMRQDVMGGDLVVATAAIRQEGTSREYLPVEYPAAADLTVTMAAVEAARAGGCRVHAGVVHCKDSFYGQHNPEASPLSYDLLHRWQAWLKGGCLASEMESASLFIVAASLGLRAGCILQVLWNQEREKAGLDNPRAQNTAPAMDAAVGAIERLIRQA